MTTLTFKGFIAEVDYEPDLKTFRGKVSNTRTLIEFRSGHASELEKEFHISVDEYLAVCRENDLVPERPYSGKLNLRLGSELHATVVASAASSGMSLNTWIIAAITERAEKDT